VSQADALARLVLGASPAEQVEDTIVILLADAATVILDLD
jgi:hypothetical protein